MQLGPSPSRCIHACPFGVPADLCVSPVSPRCHSRFTDACPRLTWLTDACPRFCPVLVLAPEGGEGTVDGFESPFPELAVDDHVHSHFARVRHLNIDPRLGQRTKHARPHTRVAA